MGVMGQRRASDAPGLVFLFCIRQKSGAKTKLSKVPGGVESLHPIWAPGSKDEPVAQPAWIFI